MQAGPTQTAGPPYTPGASAWALCIFLETLLRKRMCRFQSGLFLALLCPQSSKELWLEPHMLWPEDQVPWGYP